MSLLDFQKTLLLLYTDERVLNTFVKNRDQFLKHRELTERERQAIQKLPVDTLSTFSDDLRKKRIRVSRKIIGKIPLQESPVFVFPSHRYGPTLFFAAKNGEHEIPISYDVYAIFVQLIENQENLSLGSILQASAHTHLRRPLHRWKNVFMASVLLSRYQLIKRPVRRLS